MSGGPPAAPAAVPRIAAARILIVLLGAIGDVTRALPLLDRLRRAYPAARISWAVEPPSAPLLHAHPNLDEVLVFDRPRGAAEFLRFLRRVRRQRPDLTIDLQRHLKSGIISRCSGAALRLGFHRRNAREGNWLFNTHTIAPMPHFGSKLEQFLAFGDWLGLGDGPLTFGLWLSADEDARVEKLLGQAGARFVTAFVGSSCESRRWFPRRTAAVAEVLATRGVSTVLVGGPGDVAFGNAVVQSSSAPVVDLTGRTNLRDLIGIFRRSRAAFGPDSGPMHIAAAVGTPVVSLWGATSPGRSAPWGSEAGVLVGTAPCSPCYLRHCPIGRLCMEQIGVEAVCAKLLGCVDD